MGLSWKAELTLENLEDFATEFIRPTYLMAYKATLNKSKASSICVDALSKVFALREEYREEPEDIPPEKAISDAIEAELNKTQFANLHNSSVSADASALPPVEILISLVDKVVDRARDEMPRYAPVYSGTTGTLVILSVVAVIVAAIAFICVGPIKTGGEVSGSDAAIRADSTVRLDPEYMLTVKSEVKKSSGAGDFNCGALPVVFTLDGPDTIITDTVSASDISGDNVSLNQLSLHSYALLAECCGVYRVTAGTDDGRSVDSYCSVYDILSNSDIMPLSSGIVLSHDSTADIPLFPLGFFSSAVIAEPGRTVSSSDADLVVHQPKLGIVSLSNGSNVKYISGTETGIDSLNMTCYLPDGSARDFTMPIIVSNSAPIVNRDSLVRATAHTPTKTGATAGVIRAADADGDSVRFNLIDTTNCNVMLTPEGSFLLRVDKNYSGSAAAFVFTATDGIITTEPMTMRFDLTNNLIEETELSQDIVYYGGEEYNYELPLPQKDIDGDPLTWKLASVLSDNLTDNGSFVKISSDKTKLLYRPGKELNADTAESLALICSDGWLESEEITFTVKISENKPPVGGEGNSVTIPLDQTSVSCTLNIVDDCELDKCVISGVHRSFGGSVKPEDNWSKLIFTFTPDGTETECYVELTVKDILTEKTSVIRYNITRQ